MSAYDGVAGVLSGAIRWVLRGLLVLVLVGVAAYPVDWTVWRVRGGPVGQVSVSHYTAASMKGDKSSYFYDGTAMVDCSRSLLPEAGSGACWWVQRHPQVVDVY